MLKLTVAKARNINSMYQGRRWGVQPRITMMVVAPSSRKDVRGSLAIFDSLTARLWTKRSASPEQKCQTTIRSGHGG